MLSDDILQDAADLVMKDEAALPKEEPYVGGDRFVDPLHHVDRDPRLRFLNTDMFSFDTVDMGNQQDDDDDNSSTISFSSSTTASTIVAASPQYDDDSDIEVKMEIIAHPNFFPH